MEADEEDAPMLVNPDLPNLKAVLDAADVIVEVLDARDPLAARSQHIEEVARESGKRVLLVLNKVGTYSLFLRPFCVWPSIYADTASCRCLPEGGG